MVAKEGDGASVFVAGKLLATTMVGMTFVAGSVWVSAALRDVTEVAA